jgi:hypothetical protein
LFARANGGGNAGANAGANSGNEGANDGKGANEEAMVRKAAAEAVRFCEVSKPAGTVKLSLRLVSLQADCEIILWCGYLAGKSSCPKKVFLLNLLQDPRYK